METLLALLQKSTAYLEGKGVESARLNTELIFASVLGCRRLDLYLQFERPVTPAEQDQLRPLVVRRGRREPLQYILGEQPFHGLVLRTDSRALIPRPETEELAERVVAALGDTPPGRILDLGTGSGCLALALAAAFPEAQVVAVDASAEALELASLNAKANGLVGRVDFRLGDWLGGLGPEERFGLVVANPPYLTEEEWEAAAPEVRAFEPKRALVGGGADGGDALRRIVTEALPHLQPGGLLALETGPAQHPQLEAMASGLGYVCWESLRDLQGRCRFLLLRKPSA